MPTSASAFSRRRSARRSARRSTRASKCMGGFDFLFPRSNPFTPRSHHPFVVNLSTRNSPIPRPTLFTTTPSSCDTDDASCTSSSSQVRSYSYVERNGKADVVHKESMESKRKNAQGQVVVEHKNINYETKDGKTIKDVFQHYEIDQDPKGKFVSIKDPAGKIVYKGYVDDKLNRQEKAKRIAALIKKHRQTLAPHLRSGSSRASVSTSTQGNNEATALASLVQSELDGKSPSRSVSETRKQSRSNSKASTTNKRKRSSSTSSTSASKRSSSRAASSH